MFIFTAHSTWLVGIAAVVGADAAHDANESLALAGIGRRTIGVEAGEQKVDPTATDRTAHGSEPERRAPADSDLVVLKQASAAKAILVTARGVHWKRGIAQAYRTRGVCLG